MSRDVLLRLPVRTSKQWAVMMREATLECSPQVRGRRQEEGRDFQTTDHKKKKKKRRSFTQSVLRRTLQTCARGAARQSLSVSWSVFLGPFDLPFSSDLI